MGKGILRGEGIEKAIITAERNLDPFSSCLGHLFHLDFKGLGFIMREVGSVFDGPADAPGRYFRFQEEWEVFMNELPKMELKNSIRKWGYNVD